MLANVFTQNQNTSYQLPNQQNNNNIGKKFDYIAAKKAGVTDQAIFNYLQQQKAKGIDVYIDKNDYNNYQKQNTNTNEQPNNQTEQKKEGFITGLVKGAIKPFAEVGTSLYNAGKTTIDLLKGNNEQATNDLSASRNLPFLGETKPAFTGNDTFTQGTGKMLSYGADIGSWFIGGGEAKAGVKGILQGTKELAGQTAKDIIKGKVIPAAIKAGKEFAPVGAVSGLGKGIENIDTSQSISKNAENVGIDTAVGTISSALGAATMGGLFAGGGKVMQKVIDHYAPIEEKANNAVQEAIDKALKPSFSKVSTPNIKNRFYSQAIKAFEVINKYKPTFVDENGDNVSRNPRTLSELFQAVGQAKSKIFNLYDDIAQKSGETGAKFNAQPTIEKMQKIVNNKSYSPEVRNYVESQIPAIYELHGESPNIIQNRLKEYNNNLNAFYDGRISKAKAEVDASIANSLRTDLDQLISNTNSQPYQALKNEYGALSDIEKEVGRQNAIQARKASKGLLSFTDIFTGGDITAGILTMNPPRIVKGVVGKSIEAIYKRLNNPDTYIKNAFDLLDKIPPEFAPLVESAMKLLPAPSENMPNVSVNTPIRLTSKSPSTIEAETMSKFGNGGTTSKEIPMQKLLPTGKVKYVKPTPIILRAAEKDIYPKEINISK